MTEKFGNKIETGACEILYLNEDLADVHFVFKNEGEAVKVPANKAILAALSPVFRAMFFGQLKETGDVDIVDATSDGFKEFLQLFYLDEVALTIERIDEVVQLADKYDMIRYINNFANWLTTNLTPENVCFAYQLSIATNDVNLKKLCEANIIVYASSVIASDSFVRCNQTVLKHILEMESLKCDEASIFCASMEWATLACKKNGLDENKGENKREVLGDCLYLIRFGTMNAVECAQLAQMHQTLFTSEELVELFFATTTGKNKSNKFKSDPRLSTEWKWNKDRKIVCMRKSELAAVRFNVLEVESAWFSCNELVLLGELTLPKFTCSEEFTYNLSVVEQPKLMFDADAEKVLHSAQVNLQRKETDPVLTMSYVLPQPVVIIPENMYEIRMEKLSQINGHHFNLFKCNVALENGLVIEFHQHPSQSENSSQRGLVYALLFNSIPNF